VDEERRRILEMLEQGKISAAEADELLAALEAPSRKEDFVGLGSERAPRLHIRITDIHSGRVKTDVVIPTGMLGRKWAKRLAHLFSGHPHMGPPHMRGLEEAAKVGTKGTIVDVSDDRRGERVEIVIE
jgi:hypothetical protein